MGFMRVQAAFERVGALPEDAIVNTFHFLTDGAADTAAAAEIIAALDADFYNEFQLFLSAAITGSYVCKAYDLEDPEPRSPVLTSTQTIGPGSGAALPSEVALCLSYRSTYESGEPNARRRGRVYIGPLDGSAGSTLTGGDVRPDGALVTALVAAAEAFRDSIIALGHAWCVYSPTTDASETLLDSFFPITQGWVDNAFDTQRRRGARATSRTTWS